MVRKIALSIFALLALLAFSSPSQAQYGRMVMLGDAHVDGNVDHDSIHVGRHDGTFRAIQLRVRGGDIRFDRIVVRFGNGTQEQLSIRSIVPSGSATRIIDLPGDRRTIESVDLWYEKASWSHRPEVKLFGVL